jgi:O-antigen ligase
MVDTPGKVAFALKLVAITGIVFLVSGLFQRVFDISPIPQLLLSVNGSHILSFKGIQHIELVSGAIDISRTNSMFLGLVATGCYTAQLLILGFAGLGAKSKAINRISKIVIALGIPVLLFTYSRAAQLSFAVGLILLVLFNKKRRLFYLFGLLAAFFVFLTMESVSSRFHESTSLGIEASTNEQHLVLWFLAVRMFLERPLLGYGAGNFFSHVGSYGPFAHIWGFTGFVGEGQACHNIFLQTAAESGVFALISLILFLFFLYKKLLSSYYNCPLLNKWQISGLLCSVIVGIIVNLISNFFTREAFWVLLGLASAAANVYGASRDSKETCTEIRRTNC